MRRPNTLLATGLVSMLLILTAVAYGAEEKVTNTKVPKAVLEAFKTRFPDAKMTGSAKEMDEGKVVYEITSTQNGHNIDATFSPEGSLVAFERGVSMKELPKAVNKTLHAKYPNARYKRIEEMVVVKNKEEKFAYYEAQLLSAKQALEVQVSSEGKVLKVIKQ